MNFFRFLVSKLFIKNLLYAILIGIGLIIFALQVLKVYTRHGQAKLVPNLTGISVSEVQKICKKKGLRYQITDSVYLSNKPKGTVIEQNPSPNFRVKKNRTIFLIINAFNPELVKMPNVKGVSFRQAKAIIEAKGLKVGKIEYVRDIAINNVLGVKFQGGDLKTNTEIPKYSKIDFVLGNGYGYHHTYVPDLLGLKIDESKDKIIDSYCNIGSVIYDNTVKNYSDSINAFVYKQFPEYDNKPIKHGIYVDIWLTLDSDKIIIEDSTNISTDFNND